MTIKTQLNNSMKDAMKSGDDVRKRTVRMALAAVKQAEVDKPPRSFGGVQESQPR
jgi:uncharacterized protein YqeY